MTVENQPAEQGMVRSAGIREKFMTAQILKGLSRVEKYLISGLLFFNVAILFVTVLLRYLFNNPPVWPEEASRYVMIWIIYLGVSQSIENNTEIKIDILSQLITSAPVQKMLHIIAAVISIAMSVFMVFFGFEFAKMLVATQQVAASFPMMMTYIYSIIPIAGILMTIKFTIRLSTQLLEFKSSFK